MTASKDPFPMHSEEARRLAGSSSTTADWNTMETSTAQSVRRTTNDQQSSASEARFIKKNNASKNDGDEDNIYEDIDNENSQ